MSKKKNEPASADLPPSGPEIDPPAEMFEPGPEPKVPAKRLSKCKFPDREVSCPSCGDLFTDDLPGPARCPNGCGVGLMPVEEQP